LGQVPLPLALQLLAAWLAPPACVACAAPLAAAGGHLCPACRRALPWLGRVCPRCALPAHGASGACPAARGPLSAAWAPLAYAGPARESVVALKFRGALPVADAMAAAMAAGAPPPLLAGATLVPVPSARGRQRRRGFDHAELLARALARRTGLPLRRALCGRGPPSRQTGAGRRARIAPARHRVVARGGAPPVSLLVDDVHTTGATLSACACALRAAGGVDVRAITYARTL
jgi:predicted amidophosphoribosyltransferase